MVATFVVCRNLRGPRLAGFGGRLAPWKHRGEGENQADSCGNSAVIGAFPANFLQCNDLLAVGSGSIITEVGPL